MIESVGSGELITGQRRSDDTVRFVIRIGSGDGSYYGVGFGPLVAKVLVNELVEYIELMESAKAKAEEKKKDGEV